MQYKDMQPVYREGKQPETGTEYFCENYLANDFEEIFSNIPLPFLYLDSSGSIYACNTAFHEYVVVEDGLDKVLLKVENVFGQSSANILLNELSAVNSDSQISVLVLQDHRGNPFIANIFFIKESGQKDKLSTFTILLEPVQREAHEKAHDLRLSIQALNYVKKGIIIADSNKKIIKVNPEFTGITGYEPQDVIGLDPSILSSGKHSNDFYDKMWKKIYSKGSWSGEIWNKTKKGKLYLEWLTISLFKDQLTGKDFFIGVFSDVTAKKFHQKKLDQLAYFDSLTGLPNRTLLQKELLDLTNLTVDAPCHFALLFIDLDEFKAVNDSHGHSQGDELLKQAASRIKSSIRNNDFAARLGGDEFVVIFKGVQTEAHLNVSIDKLLQALSKPYYIQDQIHLITASIGVSLFPLHADTHEELMRKADIAMYEAKNSGNNSWLAYDTKIEVQNNQISQNIQLIKNAISDPHRYIRVHYQPIVSSFDKRGKKYQYFECLVRLQDAERLVFPNEFIELSEQQNLIVEFGEAILHAICRDIIENQFFDGIFSVNLSPKQFEQEDFIDILHEIISSYGLKLNMFKFEVTETAVIQNLVHMEKSLMELRRKGVEILLDDFGTGYASLAMLKKLPVDTLKIDRSFCSDLDRNADAKILVQAIISMAKAMRLKIVCEGVETKTQFEWLKSQNVEYCQGYLFAQPDSLANLYAK